ncbi:MAG TPA: SGNH/GDSL hydrolase family protein [Polyangiaceae bacterium]
MSRLILLVSAALILAQPACGNNPPPSNDDETGGSPSAGSSNGGSAGTAVTGGLGGTTSAGTGAGGVAGTSAGTGGTTAPTGGTAGSGATSGTGGAALGGAGPAGTGGTAGSAGALGGSGGVAGSAMGGMAGSNRAGNGGTAGRASGGASGAAGTATGGSGGGGAFDPCPATGDCKILPLGDSITDGLVVPGGYRIELFHLALQAMKHITYVGGSVNGPTMVDGVTFPRSHEGHSGWTISQIDGIVPSPALGVNPHIILLHIGTNDMRGGVNGASTRLGTLIDQIIMAQPNALLVVSNIVPYPAESTSVTTYNAAVPGVVQMRAQAGKHILFVDQFMGFPTSELQDGIHPNTMGYARMARAWYAAISSYLH